MVMSALDTDWGKQRWDGSSPGPSSRLEWYTKGNVNGGERAVRSGGAAVLRLWKPVGQPRLNNSKTRVQRQDARDNEAQSAQAAAKRAKAKDEATGDEGREGEDEDEGVMISA